MYQKNKEDGKRDKEKGEIEKVKEEELGQSWKINGEERTGMWCEWGKREKARKTKNQRKWINKSKKNGW